MESGDGTGQTTREMTAAVLPPRSSDGARRVRVLVVDDNAGFRESLLSLLDSADLVVIGEARTGVEALDLVPDLRPDVVLMDVNMPEMNGIETTRALKERFPTTGVVALSGHEDQDIVREMLVAGASGYVLKDAEADEVATAIRSAFAGEVHLDPAVARLLAQRMRQKKDPAEDLVEPLTEREKDVLRLLGQGRSNKEIGAELFITERTARTYVSNILGKLGLASRTQAALWAVEHKLAE